MRTQTSSPKKWSKNAVVWAIQPDERLSPVWQRSQELAIKAAQSFHRPLQPVFVADRQFVDRKGGAGLELLHGRLERLLKPLQVRNLRQPQVLVPQRDERSSHRLTRGAGAKAELIVVGTNARQGLKRFFEGSFAEAVLSQSRIPVLLVNARCRAVRPFKKILFATDFTDTSFRAFQKLCQSAQRLGAAVEIFSVLPDPLRASNPVFTMGMWGMTVLTPEILDAESHRLYRIGRRWLKYARAVGLKASLNIVDDPRPVSQAIEAHAKSWGADMIALAALQNPDQSHLLGSVTQDVIRHSPLPVWTFRPSPSRKSL